MEKSICRYGGIDCDLYFPVQDTGTGGNSGGSEQNDGINGYVVQVVELKGEVYEEMGTCVYGDTALKLKLSVN